MNWQTVRQNNVIISGYFKIFATNDSSPQTIVQSKSLPRTVFWENGCSPTGEYVRGGLLANAFTANDRSVSPMFTANIVCHRRTKFRHWRILFAANIGKQCSQPSISASCELLSESYQ
ncbi:MAG: hypothetical protein GY774_14745 [Planctomycetes bacterium]|nr:hypothetical protein [Planctomycetota bacterium]